MVVLCDSHYLPIQQISIEHAVHLLFSGKAEPIYGTEGLEVVARLGLAPTAIENWSHKLKHLIDQGKFLVPALIRLTQKIAFRAMQIRPSRNAIFRRDKHTCQYCGDKTKISLDHVLPVSRGGKNTWENLVTACFSCNNRKGNKTPEEAGMKLLSTPKHWSPAIPPDLFNKLLGF